MLNMQSNRQTNLQKTTANSRTQKQLHVLFKSCYSEKWLSISQIKNILLFNTLGENVRLLESIIKEFAINWPLVVFQIPLNQKLTKSIVDCILEENIEDCFITREEMTFITTMKTQFPEDYQWLKALLLAANIINKPLKQRYDTSGRWFGTELFY